MKPIIGITSHIEQESKYVLNRAYVNAIVRAGGIPLIVPASIEDDVSKLVQKLDGLLLSGGGDIDPTLFGEEPHPGLGEISPLRDSVEMVLIHEMLAVNKPILGICRGIQILNIAMGGNMYQDIYTQQDEVLLQHSQIATKSHRSHFVQVENDTILHSIAQAERIKVNSFHHQAVKDVPKPLIVSGVASDGIIEAIESKIHHFVVGVQWHPEELVESEDGVSIRLFKKFVQACVK
ncbi:gamma-glutamyl-gamma-aminobutyrate hydrolase family protein [Bacillus niameyensis]|uniref:gamma-glutamyl-gamma-aminobutyrate hydrolase family protein n=1 Tax=Bacillus niameyensis TaxID=1522308 RepID=UPI000785EB45|nr:gamma-glutamyl-gamma-aminobutyrate hydrolase family protein [Bacillus niameyensis]